MAPPIGMLALSDQVSVIRTKEVKYYAILWLKFVIVTPKGQLILECPFGVFKCPKNQQKNIPGFLP